MNPLDRIGEFTRWFMTVDLQLRQQKELIEEVRADLKRVNDKLATLYRANIAVRRRKRKRPPMSIA